MEAIVKASQNKKKKLQNRLQEILLEILIIVFAVSISIWFHNWAESRKDHADARKFLVGLREDLQGDMQEMEGDLKTCQQILDGTRYFERLGRGEPLNNDSLNAHQLALFTSVQIDPRASRFEALKSSGRLGIIENDSLLLHITDLYTKDIPLVTRQNDYYITARREMLSPYLAQHLVIDTSGKGANWQELFRTSAMRLYMAQGESIGNNIRAYTLAVAKCRLIIKEIDAELR